MNTNGVISAPTLYLRCACPVKSTINNAFIRYASSQEFADAGTPTLFLKHPETQLSQVPTYDEFYNIASVSTNQEALDDLAQLYIDGVQNNFELAEPVTMRYIGIRNDIRLDGAISQITFETGPGGAFTTACYNDELAHILPSFKERELQRKAAQIGEIKDAAKPAAQQNAPGKIATPGVGTPGTGGAAENTNSSGGYG